jgi:hypothetical protein
MIAELVPLSDDERTSMPKANDDLLKLGRIEESKWSQRAKVKLIQEGGGGQYKILSSYHQL